jgi:phytoene/squalene synthetase
MSLDACARLVEKGDPDRFQAVLAAAPAARSRLLPLYAFNLEVARAPWVTQEPLIAGMRLQFWRDTLAADAPRAHEVAGPLHRVIHDSYLDINTLDRLVAARLWDVWGEPHADADALDAYIEDTAAGLLWAAGQAVGAPPRAEHGLRALGWAQGLASYLRAVPDLKAKGRHPLPDESPAAIRALARRGLDRLAMARRVRDGFGPGADAALAAWQAPGLLALAEAEPERVLTGRLALSEFSRRGRLLWMALSGRF